MTKEELKVIGLTDEQIQEVFKLRGLELNQLKEENAILKTDNANLKTQIETANTQIKDFKDMDIESLKKSVFDYENKYNELKNQSEKDINTLKFEHSVDMALNRANAKNIKAVKALLDMETLSNSKNIDSDLKKTIEELKEKESYLFNIEDTNPQIKGASPASSGDKNGQNVDLKNLSYEDFLKTL